MSGVYSRTIIVDRWELSHTKGDLPVKIKGTLRGQEIAQAVDAATTELERAGIEDKLRLIFRLAIEEILLLYREHSGESTPFSLHFRKWNGDFNVRLTVGGEAFNPLEQDSFVLMKIGRLHRFRNLPVWRFEKGQNRILFVFTLYNTTMKNLLFSWKYTVNSRKTLGVSVFCQIISAVMGIVAPAISARIIIAYTHNETHRVIYIVLALLGVQLLRNLFLVLSNMGYNRAYTRTLSALEKDLVANVLQIESPARTPPRFETPTSAVPPGMPMPYSTTPSGRDRARSIAAAAAASPLDGSSGHLSSTLQRIRIISPFGSRRTKIVGCDSGSINISFCATKHVTPGNETDSASSASSTSGTGSTAVALPASGSTTTGTTPS